MDCATTTQYQDALCTRPCKYAGTNYQCQANPSAQICGDPGPSRALSNLGKLVVWAMGG